MVRPAFAVPVIFAVLVVGCHSQPSMTLLDATQPATNGTSATSGASGASGGGGRAPLRFAAKRATSGGGASGVTSGGGVLAYINSQPVRAPEMREALVEAAGGQVLSELVLDHAIEQRLREANLALTPALLEAEKQRMLETLAPGDANQATRLLDRLRAQRGLGKQRFVALLRRNAALRLLVETQKPVKVSDAALRQAYDQQYGPRYQGRILVVPSAGEAQKLRERIEHGASFSDLALAHSTDTSKAAGGLLPPISSADAGYPALVRRTLVKLAKSKDKLSDVIALDGQFAVLTLVRKIPAQKVQLADVKDALTRQVRQRLERLRMQQLAREMLTQAKVVVLDPALDKSWQRQKSRLTNE